jgi:hypothetical protein
MCRVLDGASVASAPDFSSPHVGIVEGEELSPWVRSSWRSYQTYLQVNCFEYITEVAQIFCIDNLCNSHSMWVTQLLTCWPHFLGNFYTYR